MSTKIKKTTFQIKIVLGIIVYVFYTSRLLNAPDYFMNYLVSVIACLPILLFYYTLMRAGYNKRKS